METTITASGIEVKRGVGGGTPAGGVGGGPQGPYSNDRNWPPGYSREDALEPAKYRIGIWVGLGSISMLFFALTSAYIWRQNESLKSTTPDWVALQVPMALWLSTGIILLSSITFEIARRALKRNQYEKFKGWISLTTVLGLLFLAGQILAWRQLAAQGIYLQSHPHSSFFYVISGLHALHLLGGMLVLIYLMFSALRMRIGVRKKMTVEMTSVYWHFMDGLWIYLFVLLFFF
jgi:cytochrome c oxidase subunit 3